MATVILRPAGALGDNSNATYTTDTGPAPGGPRAILGKALSVAAVQLVATGGLGAIASVTLAAVVRTENAGDYSPLCQLTWTNTLGGTTRAEDTDNFDNTVFAENTTATYALNPWTGVTWTWTNLNDLRDLGAMLAYDYLPANDGPVKLHVAEVYATVVYAEADPTQTSVTGSLVAGAVRGAEAVGGPVTASAIAGSAPGATMVAGGVTLTLVTQARGAEGVA